MITCAIAAAMHAYNVLTTYKLLLIEHVASYVSWLLLRVAHRRCTDARDTHVQNSKQLQTQRTQHTASFEMI
jgi:hypothetical protein